MLCLGLMTALLSLVRGRCFTCHICRILENFFERGQCRYCLCVQKMYMALESLLLCDAIDSRYFHGPDGKFLEDAALELLRCSKSSSSDPFFKRFSNSVR